MQGYLAVIFVFALVVILLIFHALGFFKTDNNERIQKTNPANNPKPATPNQNNVSGAGIAATAVMVIFLIYRAANNYEGVNQSSDFSATEALTQCQWALKKLSRDPDTADIPYVDNFGSNGEYYFAWGTETKYARMRNGLGIEVPVSASCTINASTKKITQLTFDGKAIIQNQINVSTVENANDALFQKLDATYQQEVDKVDQREQQQKMDLLRSVTNAQKRGIMESDIVIQAAQDRQRLMTNLANEKIRILDETHEKLTNGKR